MRFWPARVVELLLEQGVDLRAGQVIVTRLLPNGCTVKDLAVGHLARLLTTR
jgi:hypothetical protein